MCRRMIQMNKKSLILGAHPAWKSRKFQGFAAWACSRDKDSAPASWLCATWERASLIVRQNDERAGCELRPCFHFSRRSFVFRAVLKLFLCIQGCGTARPHSHLFCSRVCRGSWRWTSCELQDQPQRASCQLGCNHNQCKQRRKGNHSSCLTGS